MHFHQIIIQIFIFGGFHFDIVLANHQHMKIIKITHCNIIILY